MADRQPPQAHDDALQGILRSNPAEDEMRMLVAGRKERVASGFNRRMAGLHRLLRRRQIGADKHVGIRAFREFDLPESGTVHVPLLSKWQRIMLQPA
jgi:hypothetical protein